MTYWMRKLSERPTMPSGAYWAWAGHDGWHTSADVPPEPVPTQHVWVWTKDRWVYVREDPRHETVGVELRRADAQPDGTWEKADVFEAPSSSGLTSDATMRRGPEFLQSHGFPDAEAVRGRSVRVLSVFSPVRVDFFELTTTTR